ncbi:hypothetical protein GQ53DRAFT_746225 [Thozetella sp. PMI_491]|nr:hypothetical protein GQ53DRAFT_746225 [Thozetella sp. PMI_491]
MNVPTSALSQTLKSISVTKIREITKQREKYEQRKDAVLAKAAQHEHDQPQRIAELLRGIKDLYPEAVYDTKVANVQHWVQQSRYDASVPSGLLKSCEELLRGKLEVQSRRLGIAHLYSRLVTEWMEPGVPMNGEATPPEDDAFEVVDRQKERLRELCDRFEQVVFSPLDTDKVAIERYLGALFPGDDSQVALKNLRKRIADKSDTLVDIQGPFTKETLRWSIKALLAEDLLSDAKQAILRDFLENDLGLGEIADVLNMRFADFDIWEWDAGSDGIPVLPRQQLNGKYRIWMDEDVLQAIYVEYIGVRCCNLLHTELELFVRRESKSGWKWDNALEMTSRDTLRRQYYLSNPYSDTGSIDDERRNAYLDDFFMSQLPATPNSLGNNAYLNDGAGGDSEERQGWSNIKQRMLRTLATEVIMHRSLYGEAAVVQSDLQWYATGLSHTTIFAVMRFLGFPEKLVDFYRKVLQAPLNMSEADGTSTGPRTRLRGVPMAHATEKFIGEMVLFILDLVVNRETGMLIYRLHDDLFLVGKPERCARAWKVMNECAKVLGLEFNLQKTGSVYLVDDNNQKSAVIAKALPEGVVQIGHLKLDGGSGKWVINQEQVGEHLTQLKKQLGASRSILAWVQTWNSCIGRFFSHTFGEPAYCFGLEHLGSILETYRQMNRFLFGNGQSQGGGSAVNYLKAKICERFGVGELPDAFILLPEELGGLGLRNPFIPALVIQKYLQDNSCRTPETMMKDTFELEMQGYEKARKRFLELGNVDERLRQLKYRISDVEEFQKAKKTILTSFSEAERENFFSFEEYSRFREDTSGPLARVYATFVSAPGRNEPVLDNDVTEALREAGISTSDGSPKAIETKWALQMFGDELRDTVGGLSLVENKLLPLGVLAMMRQKAVRWNMVL